MLCCRRCTATTKSRPSSKIRVRKLKHDLELFTNLGSKSMKTSEGKCACTLLLECRMRHKVMVKAVKV